MYISGRNIKIILIQNLTQGLLTRATKMENTLGFHFIIEKYKAVDLPVSTETNYPNGLREETHYPSWK